MPPKPRSPSVAGQLVTCALLCALAVGITLLFHPAPTFAAWTVGSPLSRQLVIAGAFALLTVAGAIVVLNIPRLRKAMPVPTSLANIDLTGPKPIYIGLAAGVGEELLFRAALQPLLGIWLSSLVFALAHIRTASFATSRTKKAIYLANVFCVSLALGLVFAYAGLLAAVLVHATIDIAALVSLRNLRGRALAPQATT